MKQIGKIILILAIFFGSANVAASAQMHMPMGAKCPVMAGERSKEKFYVDYQGKRIYFCCRNCVKAFKRNPDKFFNLNKEILR